MGKTNSILSWFAALFSRFIENNKIASISPNAFRGLKGLLHLWVWSETFRHSTVEDLSDTETSPLNLHISFPS